MIAVILSVILILWILYKLLEDKFTPLRKIPKAQGSLPVFGHMFIFLRTKNELKLLEDWSEKHGGIFRYSRGFGHSRVYLTDPELIKHVLVSNGGNYERTQLLKKHIPSIGNGLFSSRGKDHARQRKTINPAFHYSNLANMVEDFKDVANNLVKLWSGQLEDEEVLEAPIQTDLTHLTLDIIARCAFGYNFNTVLSGDTGISKAFALLIEDFNFGRIFRKSFIPLYDYLPFAETKRFKEALEKTDRTVLEVIREKRKRKEQGIPSTRRDLLDLLLDLRDDETGSVMNDEQLRAQVFTFMLAGHDTTSVSMTWTLYELARHPDIAEQIREEVHKVFRDSVEVTWSKLAELELLGNVIKESLRLHSPAAMALRIAKNKDVIGGYEIPKGTIVSIGINSVHLSPKLWKDPYAFDPHRFDTTENESQPAVLRYTFLPFSAGSRSCIGNKFAIAEMKVVLATLVQHFTFEEIPGFTVAPVVRLTAKPNPPLRLRIKKVVTVH